MRLNFRPLDRQLGSVVSSLSAFAGTHGEAEHPLSGALVSANARHVEQGLLPGRAALPSSLREWQRSRFRWWSLSVSPFSGPHRRVHVTGRALRSGQRSSVGLERGRGLLLGSVARHGQSHVGGGTGGLISPVRLTRGCACSKQGSLARQVAGYVGAELERLCVSFNWTVARATDASLVGLCGTDQCDLST